MTRPSLFFRSQASLSEYLSKHPDAQLVWIGYRIFKWLLLLTVIVMVALGLYAVLTYPTTGEIRELLRSGAPVADVSQLTNQMRSEWISNVKDLAQLFLLTPIFPLLAAVIGYIFGRSHTVGGTAQSERERPPSEQG